MIRKRQHATSTRAVFGTIVIALLSACDSPRNEALVQDDGHELGALVYTHFTDRTELFVEFPQLVVGIESPFAAHLTDLTNFKPLLDGTVTAVLSSSGAPTERFEVTGVRSPGIFRPVIVPTRAGVYELSIELDSNDIRVTHELGEVTVFSNIEAAALAASEEDDSGSISFLKEQQWQMDFATAVVTPRILRRSLPATGILRPAANAESLITAPTSGTIVRTRERWPSVGDNVARGQRLAVIAPRLGTATDMASLELARDSAAADFGLAEQELARLEGLFANEAVPERRVREARAALAKASAELRAANQRLEQVQRNMDTGTSGVALLAPIDGTLVEVNPAEGAFINEGDLLFRVVDTRQMWLEARVPEADAAALATTPTGARFKPVGLTEELEIRPGHNGRLISVGRVIDPVSRAVSVIFELDDPPELLPMGAYSSVSLLTGESTTQLAVPEAAVVDDAGQTVVFVQTGGESYERRVVELGFRDAGYIAINGGLEAGERIVTRGAYLVRLAAASPAEAGAGHTH